MTKSSRTGDQALELSCELNLEMTTYATDRKCTLKIGLRQPVAETFHQDGIGIDVDGAW